jgi:colanic acid/amylovoran biosynthesis glycosyltransferase
VGQLADIISQSRLEQRLARNSGPLRIIYVGRVHEMKGPWHWLDAMQKLVENWDGAREIHAKWIGDGPLLDDLRREVAKRNLGDRIQFSGPENDRGKLLELLREADLFAFCHLTPESPRCLIEAMMSGLPILGFASAYASDLLGDQAGGEFVPIGDSDGLASLLRECLRSPSRLRGLTLGAHAAGHHYSDVEVFKHRSDLIKDAFA